MPMVLTIFSVNAPTILGPGQDLVSVYHPIKLSDNADRPEEVR